MPTIGAPVQGYYYDQASDTLRPLAAAGGMGGPTTVQTEVTFVADATANITLTSLVAAEDYLQTSVRHITRMDLSTYTHVRFVARRMAGAGSVGSLITLKYSVTDPANAFAAGAWTTSGAVLNIAAQNQTCDTGWIPLPAGMKVDNVYVAITQQGGDGTQSPVLGSVRAFFRGNAGAGVQGVQGIQGPTGPTGPTGPAGAVPPGGLNAQVLAKSSATDFATQWRSPAPYMDYALKGAGDNAAPAIGQITVNNATLTSVTQINFSWYGAMTDVDNSRFLRSVVPGQVIVLSDKVVLATSAAYQVTAVTYVASPSQVQFTVTYILGNGGFIADRSVWASVVGGWDVNDARQPFALGTMVRVNGVGSVAVSTTPAVLFTLAPVALKRFRQYYYCAQIRAVSASAQGNGSLIYDAVTGVTMTLNYNVPVPSGGTSFYTGFHVRVPLTVTADGTYTLNLKFALGAGTGTAYLDQGGYLQIDDEGPIR